MSLTLSQAALLIKQGRLVCFPTETVYALAADAFNDVAVEHVFKLKGRQIHTPLAVMVPHLEMAQEYGKFNQKALALGQKFWPGPLTLIVEKKPHQPPLSTLINKGVDTIAIRVPDHPMAQEILQAVNHPIVATSANPSGKESAITAMQIREYFGDALPIIGQGQCTYGIASTIIDTTTTPMRVIRVGTLPADRIHHIIDAPEA